MGAGDLRVGRVRRAAHGSVQHELAPVAAGQRFGLMMGPGAGSAGGEQRIVRSQTFGAHDPELTGEGLAAGRRRPAHGAVLLDEDSVVVKEAAVAVVVVPLRPSLVPLAALSFHEPHRRAGRRRRVASHGPRCGRQRSGEVRPFDERRLLLIGRALAGREGARIPERGAPTGSRMGAHVDGRTHRQSGRVEGRTGARARGSAAHHSGVERVGVAAVG